MGSEDNVIRFAIGVFVSLGRVAKNVLHIMTNKFIRRIIYGCTWIKHIKTGSC